MPMGRAARRVPTPNHETSCASLFGLLRQHLSPVSPSARQSQKISDVVASVDLVIATMAKALARGDHVEIRDFGALLVKIRQPTIDAVPGQARLCR